MVPSPDKSKSPAKLILSTLYRRNALVTGFVMVAVLLAAGAACYLFWLGKARPATAHTAYRPEASPD